MKGFTSQPVEGAMEYIVGAKPSCPIRICNVKRATKLQASSVCKASWQTHTPDAVAGASATAYFFAKKLQETLDVPVGVIVSSWGGSTIQAWMSKEVLASYFPNEVDLSFLERNEKPDEAHKAPTMLYNGMLAPLKNYGIKGVIWYQGCANKGEAELYSRLQPEFVKMLRRMWCNNELPFYYAQIAGFQYTGSQNLEAALIREAQLENSKIIPFSGMIVSMDCSDETCIHPGKKKPIGDRFAYLALQKTYGMSGFDAVSPLYESHEIKGNVVYVKFTKTMWGGVGHKGKSLVGFELAGEDHKFYPAEACNHSKDSHVIEVKSDMVPVPVAVRYAFRNYAPVSIYNTFGIPASPFRTDDWDE
jgi:sialate O-acetylesterase